MKKKKTILKILILHFLMQVLEESLDWEDVQWSQTGVWIGKKEYTLARVHFLSMN